MMMRSISMLAFWIALIMFASPAYAGTIYEVTSKNGEEVITYEVQFGGGQLNDMHTAFDCETKKFVYLPWPRGGEPPVPVMKVWDHRTGETISLYAFPDAKHPLPVIPSMDAMKVCPLTGDKELTSKPLIAVD